MDTPLFSLAFGRHSFLLQITYSISFIQMLLDSIMLSQYMFYGLALGLSYVVGSGNILANFETLAYTEGVHALLNIIEPWRHKNMLS